MKTHIALAFRKLRVRNNIFGTPERPRLAVYRSLNHIYAQIIDDNQGKTLAAASSREKTITNGNGIAEAAAVGEAVGKKALQKGVKKVVFDRGGRAYHGRVKALAEGARKSGLEF